MKRTAPGRRAASTRVRTPLTDLTDALSANGTMVGRRAAVAVASGGLLVSLGMPSSAADQASEAAAVVTADDSESTESTVNAEYQAAAVEAEVSTVDVAATASKAPEAPATPAPNSDSDSSSSSSNSGSKSKDSSGSRDVKVPDGSKAQQVIAIAKQYVGVPYRSGGTTPSGWDCSGFTSYVYKKVGVNLPRTSGAQKGAGTVVSASEAQPGDLVWHPGHVGIYAGNGMMYDAGSSSSNTSYRSHSWMGSVTYIRVL